MNDLKNYVFYILVKNDNLINENGLAYGVKRGNCHSHDSYYHRFINIDPFVLDDINVTSDWQTTLPSLAASGNVIIANTAIEIENIEDRLYAIYLPSHPNMYQLNVLNSCIEEFKKIDIDVGVFGEYEDMFNELRLNSNFDSLTFLKEYININMEQINSKKMVLQKTYR